MHGYRVHIIPRAYKKSQNLYPWWVRFIIVAMMFCRGGFNLPNRFPDYCIPSKCFWPVAWPTAKTRPRGKGRFGGTGSERGPLPNGSSTVTIGCVYVDKTCPYRSSVVLWRIPALLITIMNRTPHRRLGRFSLLCHFSIEKAGLSNLIWQNTGKEVYSIVRQYCAGWKSQPCFEVVEFLSSVTIEVWHFRVMEAGFDSLRMEYEG